jgi:hypothetical protein
MPPSNDTPARLPEPSKPESAWRSGNAALWIFAVALLVSYVVVHVWLYFKADDPGIEALWDRYTFIVASLDSVVTVVVGWLFGREVHRRAYEDAKSREAKSRTLHVDAERRAQHGAGLATALRGVLAAAQPRISAGPGSDEGEEPPSPQISVEHLADQVGSIVEKFFPQESEGQAAI